jgi:hypothetical protein
MSEGSPRTMLDREEKNLIEWVDSTHALEDKYFVAGKGESVRA